MKLVINNKDTFWDKDDYEKYKNLNWKTIKSDIKNCYLYANIDSKTIYLHRLIMNPPVGYVIDHIDGNGLNNQKSNLRICTHAENTRNRTKVNKNNTSGYNGVSWYKRDKKWAARINVSYRTINLGRFLNKDDAINKRKEAEIKYFNL